MNKSEIDYNRRKSRAFLVLYLLEISKTIKYNRDVSRKEKEDKKVYMTEETGTINFNRLYKAFVFFISNEELFSWETHNEIYKQYLMNLPYFAQAVLNKEDHKYAATYYFKYAGVKYAVDIEEISPEEEEFQSENGRYIFCNVVEFGDTSSYLDNKKEIIFVYDKEEKRVIDILSVTENERNDNTTRISGVLNNATIEAVQKRVLIQ